MTILISSQVWFPHFLIGDLNLNEKEKKMRKLKILLAKGRVVFIFNFPIDSVVTEFFSSKICSRN